MVEYTWVGLDSILLLKKYIEYIYIIQIYLYELFVDYNSWVSCLKNIWYSLQKSRYLLILFLLQNQTSKLDKPNK